MLIRNALNKSSQHADGEYGDFDVDKVDRVVARQARQAENTIFGNAMGTKAALLLVVSLLIGMPVSAAIQTENYREFWRWSGVKPTSALRNAQAVYLHQGEIVTRQGPVVFERMGLPMPITTLEVLEPCGHASCSCCNAGQTRATVLQACKLILMRQPID